MKAFIFVTLIALGSTAFGLESTEDKATKVIVICSEHAKNKVGVLACMYSTAAHVYAASISLAIENSEICRAKNIKSGRLCFTSINVKTKNDYDFTDRITGLTIDQDSTNRIAKECAEDKGWFSYKCIDAISRKHSASFEPHRLMDRDDSTIFANADLEVAIGMYSALREDNNILKKSELNAIYSDPKPRESIADMIGRKWKEMKDKKKSRNI